MMEIDLERDLFFKGDLSRVLEADRSLLSDLPLFFDGDLSPLFRDDTGLSFFLDTDLPLSLEADLPPFVLDTDLFLRLLGELDLDLDLELADDEDDDDVEELEEEDVLTTDDLERLLRLLLLCGDRDLLGDNDRSLRSLLLGEL